MTDTKPARRRAGDNHRFWLVPTVRLMAELGHNGGRGGGYSAR
jgi:hypothetical protein